MSNITQGLFKHIPCPSGEACTTVRCLFGHADAGGGQSTSTSPPPLGASAARASEPHIEATAPHRPLAVDSSSRAPPAGTKRSSQRDDKIPKRPSPSKQQQHRQTQQHPQPAHRATRIDTISPPPLKRKREDSADSHGSPRKAAPHMPTNAGSETASAALTAARTATAPAPSPNPLGDTAKAPPVPLPKRKAEALNPRFATKAPAKHEVRLRLVRLLHAEFCRLNKALLASKDRAEERKQYVLTDQGLIWAALDLEEHYAITKSATVYSDTVKHRIMDFKRMTVDQWIKERMEAKEKARRARQGAAAGASVTAPARTDKPTKPSDPATTAGFLGPAPPPKLVVTGLPQDQEFVLLTAHFITPIDKLANQGYVPKVPSPEDIRKARDAEEVSKGWEQCDRCTRRFQVFPGRREDDGALTSGGKCQYHPGRLNRQTQVFSCCNEAPETSTGCETTSSHVFKTKDPKRMAALWNFVETPENPDVPVNQAVSFDCEMAYTVYGMEVVRLTVVAWPSGEPLLDVLVRPLGEVIDLNSRFSGIWPKDFARAVPFAGTSAKELLQTFARQGTTSATAAATVATTTKEAVAGSERQDGKAAADGSAPPLPIVASPAAARTLFHSLISPETVLIGHALENDLNTMRMVHPRLADTVLLFPHPKGLPIRYSLKALAKEHMDQTIQTSILSGHDSAEDARAAGDLVRTKIKAKWASMCLEGWRLIDGRMTQGR